MERNRSSKIIAVVALVVAVFGLTLGFAAFSNTLTISSSAFVSPSSENFKINFSTSSTDATATGALIGDVAEGSSDGVAAEEATLSGTTVSGIKANLKVPGDSVSYTFYVHNTGEYDAFLNSITFENVTGESSPKVCTAVDKENTTATLVSAACEDIEISVKVGDDNAETGSVATISNHQLLKTAYETVVVTITYTPDGAMADGDFNVSFGDLKLVYGTID